MSLPRFALPHGDDSAAPVALVGWGRVGSATLRAMLTSGIRMAHIAGGDGDEVSDGDAAMPDLRYTRADLQRSWPEAWIETHDGPDHSAAWGLPWLPSCRVCILCADVVEPSLALAVNARCLEYGVALLPGLLLGHVGQAGPLTEPGRSACMQCVDLRLQAVTQRTCLAPFGPPDGRVATHLGQELARRVSALQAGRTAERGLSYHWPDGSTTRHEVLRTAHCASCAPIGRQPSFCGPAHLPFSDAETSPRRILEVEDRLVDPMTGPVRSLERYDPGPGDPQVKHWVASLTEPGWAQAGHVTLACGGSDLDDNAAKAAALGEALERMSACQPAPAELLVAPYRDIAAQAVDPLAWDLFDDLTRAQPGFPYPHVAPDQAISWAWGWSLLRHRPVLVPASRVFVPFQVRTPGDQPDYPTLSGFATGSTLAEAALAGLLEVVERDAFTIAWANRLSLPQLDLDRSSPGGVGEYVAEFEDRGVEVRCSLLELDLRAPTVIAIARAARAGDPAMVIATAADLDVAGACRRALAELAANRLNVRYAMTAPLEPHALQSPDVIDAAGHGRLYARPEMAVHLSPWWAAREKLPLRRPGGRPRAFHALRGLVETIAAAGLETIVVDLTPPEIDELGLSSVKVLVPGAYPLNFDGRWLHLGGRRLRTAPVAAGLLDHPLAFEALNRLPHPFP